MKFPTIKEMAQNVAEKALDEFEYKGKTLRQWIDIISASEHGTNLAEVGTDAVSRKAVKELAYSQIRSMYCGVALKEQRETMLRIADNVIGLLAPVVSTQPEIVRCGECKWFQCNMRPDGYLPQGVDEFECRHWCGSCDLTDFCSFAERREVTT